MQLKEKESREELKEEIGRAKEEIEEKADSLLRETFPKEEILLDETLPPLKDTPSMGGKMPGWKGSEVVIRHPLYVVGIRVDVEGHFADILLQGGVNLQPYVLRLYFPKNVVASAPLPVRGGAGLVFQDTKEKGKYYLLKVWEADNYSVELELYEGSTAGKDTLEVIVGGATAELVNGSILLYGGYWGNASGVTPVGKKGEEDLRRRGVGVGPGFWLHLERSFESR